mmetsp:Transcript_8169/g.15373  ORF Transcript_8169/g.15373 Transcript_8169/m.15373 type:complete len:199 (-) Transcript_8169:78-674(-)
MTFFFSLVLHLCLFLLLLHYNNNINYCHGFVPQLVATTTTHSSSILTTTTKTLARTTLVPALLPLLRRPLQTSLYMATISEAEAKKGIDKVVSTLRQDKQAIEELGKLTKVNNILGYGSPKAGVIAVRFNASFQKSGRGMSSVPLPFGLGQSNKSEGRGTMVGQVKASLDVKSGNLLECSVFRDLGYGRAFNLQCKKS